LFLWSKATVKRRGVSVVGKSRRNGCARINDPDDRRSLTAHFARQHDLNFD
jgi:hypothetical protein